MQSDAFAYPNGTRVHVENKYSHKGTNSRTYFKELGDAKFALSPGGWGLDCYRHWEALSMGTIPVIEHLDRVDGWFRTFDDLPVAWIDHLTNVTPQWLEDKYKEIVSQWDTYNWEKMTKHYWNNMVLSYLPRCEDQSQCEGWMDAMALEQMEAKYQADQGKKRTDRT